MNIQASTFEDEVRNIGRNLMRAAIDRDLGAPKGANVKVEAHLGIITIYWTGNGKTFSVDQFVPAHLWEAAKITRTTDAFVSKCIRGMKKELSTLKRDHLLCA